MIGIKSVASYVPVNSRDNLQEASRFGKDEQFVRERIGALALPLKSSDEETSDLAVKAIYQLLEKSGAVPNSIECLIVCTQNPDGQGLPHTSAIVQDKAGMSKNIAAFDISLGCSGYVYGLIATKGFMAAAGYSRGILVTADPYSKILDFEDANTSMLFGDAATATLVSSDPLFAIGRPLLSTDGSGGSSLRNEEGRLHMNGRQIFNFAATQVPSQILALTKREGVTLDDIDQIILHQGSRYIVNTIARRLKMDPRKLPQSIEQTGNTVSSSIPLILETSIKNPALSEILLSGFGVGLSWGSLILSRT